MGPATIAAKAEVARYEVSTHGESDTLPRSFAIFGRAATIAKPSKAATATTVKLARVMGRYSPFQMLLRLFNSGDDEPTDEDYLGIIRSSCMISKFGTVIS